MSEFQSLLALFHKQVIVGDKPIALWRGLGVNGIFSVKSFYENLLSREEEAFPCNAICLVLPIVEHGT